MGDNGKKDIDFQKISNNNDLSYLKFFGAQLINFEYTSFLVRQSSLQTRGEEITLSRLRKAFAHEESEDKKYRHNQHGVSEHNISPFPY
jgi:hypothetical protein